MKIKVFINGVFDLIHPGHLKLLEFSKKLGDELIVGINSDTSVKKIKGNSRPIISDIYRKKMLESIKFVDSVIIFNETNPKKIIKKIKPDIIVKGDHYSIREVRKLDEIDQKILIKLVKIDQKFSTTKIIQKIKNLND